jgi:hypothetical protein
VAEGETLLGESVGLAFGTIGSGNLAHDAAFEQTLYEESYDKLLVVVAAVSDLKTAVRYAHPWFGPLGAFDWQAHGNPRMQFERIIAANQ